LFAAQAPNSTDVMVLVDADIDVEDAHCSVKSQAQVLTKLVKQ
jgi:hypothetical protein